LADTVNRALSTANSCLYGICHSAIVAAGYSPALGFIHTGKLLSFVLDVADLYKTEISIPAAFLAAADGPAELEAKVRRYLRNLFHEEQLLARIVQDIDEVLDTGPLQMELEYGAGTVEPPPRLWDPDTGEVRGGVNYGAANAAQLSEELRAAVARKTAASVQAGGEARRRTRRASPSRPR
jgi:CRISPR-associated protein Cas1